MLFHLAFPKYVESSVSLWKQLRFMAEFPASASQEPVGFSVRRPMVPKIADFHPGPHHMTHMLWGLLGFIWHIQFLY